MADEHCQAISFAEYYFALVDGIFHGFENHLAKDVVLDWFGRTIRGKKNVAAFIQFDKVSTSHIFAEIKPISDIVLMKKRRNRKRRVRQDQVANVRDAKCETDTGDRPREITPVSGVNARTNDHKINNNLDDLSEPKITSVDVEKIQLDINGIKLEEEMASSVKPIKRERGQGDESVAEAGTIKYVEANGQVKFTRSVMQEDPWSYHWTSLGMECWKRKCRLKIAYSRRIDSEPPEIPCTRINTPIIREHANPTIEKQRNASMKPQSKQPSLEEIIRISNKLIPDVNHFGGYLKPLNYAEDRDNFLKDFETEIAQKNPDARLPIARYIDNKLIFTFKEDSIREKLYAGNYQIHSIVYERVEISKHAAQTAIE